MDRISKQIKKWIKNGRDPRSAHWQGGLEAILDLLSPKMTPGKLFPAAPLDEKSMALFETLLIKVDLSPNLMAVYLPPSLADNVVPPESADELIRIDKGQPSCKLLIARPAREMRILCAELSTTAKKPGADIFQEGALLGSYNYETSQECIDFLTKIIQTHLWKKDKWSREDHRQYTMNWFERVRNAGKETVPVQESSSYLHSPTLIRADRVTAVFSLILDTLSLDLRDSDSPLFNAAARLQNIPDKKEREAESTILAEQSILEILGIMRDQKLVEFDKFSDKENEAFKEEFARTLLRLKEKMR